MCKFNYLSLSVLLVSAPVWSMKFSAPLNQLKLPVMLSTEQPPAIKYTPPGEIAVSALRMCGDGDVAHFAGEHGDFEFMPHEVKKFDVVLGYWVVEEGASGDALAPNASNWHPIAYKKVDIAEKPAELTYEGNFLPMTHAPIAGTVNVMNLMKFDLMNLHNLAVSSFESTKSYRVYAGAFGCHEPDGASELVDASSSSYQYKPSSVETLRSLEAGLPAAVENKFAGSMIIADLLGNNKLKIDLKSNVAARMVPSKTPSPYDFTYENSGIDVEAKANKLYGIYKNIMETEFPVAPDVDSYKTEIASKGWFTDVSGYTAADKIAFCNGVGATSNKTEKVYPNLEAFSVNLTCKNLYGGSALDTAFRDLATPTTTPSVLGFTNLKKALAKRFFLAASFEAAQSTLDSTAVVARSGCFKKSGQKMIGRVMASYPFRFNHSAGKYVIQAHQGNHLHPESLFALSDFNRYFTSDATAIWGQVVPAQADLQMSELRSKHIQMKLNDKSDLIDKKLEDATFNAPININFKVRSVGGSCTIYC